MRERLPPRAETDRPGTNGGQGHPLPSAVVNGFAGVAGHSLAEVRVHDGPEAGAATEQLGARAWSAGGHVVLGGAAGTATDRYVLAHELAHAAGQVVGGERADGERPWVSNGVGRHDDPVELATHRTARRWAWGLPAPVVPDPSGLVRRLPPGRNGEALVLRAGSFVDAAQQFAAILTELGETRRWTIVVVGAHSVQVFDQQAAPLSGTLALRIPPVANLGVHVKVTAGEPLHQLVRAGGGYVPGPVSAGNLNFDTDIEGFQEVAPQFRGTQVAYVIPGALDPNAQPSSEPPPPSDPLVEVHGEKTANRPAWPGAVVPLGPQVTASHSTGSFLMRLENNQGINTLDRVTNLMQPIAFRWEVLKLDAGFRPIDKQTREATRWDALQQRFERRSRNAEADRRSLLGEHPERQSVPESVIRNAIAEQVHDTRLILGMVGEVALTIVNVLTDRPDNPFSEDIIDVPFREPGDYFVRCLATPVSDPDAPVRRATTVAGASVSVFDIAEFAQDALGTDTGDADAARRRLAELDQALATPPDESGTPAERARAARRRAFAGFERDYRRVLADAGGDQVTIRTAEQTFLQAKVGWLSGPDRSTDVEEVRTENARLLESLRGELERVTGTLTQSTALLGDARRTAVMQALVVDEATGVRVPLTFSIGERQYVATDRLEVVIADVSDGHAGRVFSGMGDGFLGAGRRDAWRAAMRDVRDSLHRGRGWLAYRVPAAYASYDLDLPNPMQLQMSALDMAAETVDDAAHVATVAAILAAPITGGASLEVLAVLAPIQAATSAYRLVERSVYGDLEIDSQSIGDLINIATLGLGGVGPARQFASRGVQIVAGLAGVAVRVLQAGQFVVLGWDTWRALTAPDEPGADPRESRRRKLVALLSVLEAVSIPVAEHAFPEAGRPGARPAPERTGEPRPIDREPASGDREGRPREVDEGGPVPESRRTAGPAEHADLRRGLPADLAGIDLQVDTSPDFGSRTVRVEYTVEGGVITDIRLRVGRRAGAREVAEHVRTIRSMQRYQGVGGRVRVLLERVTRWIGLHPGAELGSRAWEARLELEKLGPIIEARAREMADPATSPQRRAELEADLVHLETQAAEHAALLESMTTDPGRGYVAAEGRTAGEQEAARQNLPKLPDPTAKAADGTTSLGEYIWRYSEGRLEVVNRGDGPKLVYDKTTGSFIRDTRARVEPRFAASTSRGEAYTLLGGREPVSEFGRFTSMLVAEGLATHQQLIDLVQEPAGLRYDTVRGNLKQRYAALVVEHLSSSARLAATPTYAFLKRQGMSHHEALRGAGHAEMVRLTRGLYESDRGAIAERWYEAYQGGGQQSRQVTVTREAAAAAGATTVADRRLDRVSGGMIEELKNVTHALDAGDRAAIDDQLALVGHEITVGGAKQAIGGVKVVFLDPLGAQTNRRYMYERLAPGRPGADSLVFEIFSARGDSMWITQSNRDVLTNQAALDGFLRFGRTP